MSSKVKVILRFEDGEREYWLWNQADQPLKSTLTVVTNAGDHIFEFKQLMSVVLENGEQEPRVFYEETDFTSKYDDGDCEDSCET